MGDRRGQRGSAGAEDGNTCARGDDRSDAFLFFVLTQMTHSFLSNPKSSFSRKAQTNRRARDSCSPTSMRAVLSLTLSRPPSARVVWINSWSMAEVSLIPLLSLTAIDSLADPVTRTLGEVTISNDGATIMKLFDIVHPAAKTLVDIARSQDAEVNETNKKKDRPKIVDF